MKGDLVEVIRGDEIGKQGNILSINKKNDRVVVEGVNEKIEKLEFDSEEGVKGETKVTYQPIFSCRVNLVDPSNQKPTRIKMGYLEDGTKVRISKKTGTLIPFPKQKTDEEKYRHKIDGPLDTPLDKVQELTYQGEDFEGIKKDFDDYISKKDKIEKSLVFED